MQATELETNRQTALEFFRRFDANDVPGVLDLMADDIGYWLAGKTGSNATAGRVHNKEEMAGIFRRMLRALKDGHLRMKVKHTTAEGDRVAVEAESYGELQNACTASGTWNGWS